MNYDKFYKEFTINDKIWSYSPKNILTQLCELLRDELKITDSNNYSVYKQDAKKYTIKFYNLEYSDIGFEDFFELNKINTDMIVEILFKVFNDLLLKYKINEVMYE